MRLNLVAAAACGLLLSSMAQAAEVKVLASGAVKEAALELFPQFEKTSGNKVTVTWAGTVDIKKKVAAGETFDLIIVAAPELDAFAKDGKIVAGSKVDLVRSSVGVAVKAGLPKPSLNSGEDLKKALLAAKSVGYSTGPSGVYMLSLFEKMGIADQIKAKAKVNGPGIPVATSLRDGSAEIGFQQVSELIHEAGIDFIGPIPADVQNITVFSSGVQTGAQAQTEARALQKFLTAPAAAPIIKKHGLERPVRVPSAS
jgi:molybdate transport system substrate-binding protein